MVFTFRLVLTSTPQQLPKVMPKFNEARFSTPAGNSAVVYLSYSPITAETVATRFEIAAGKDFPLKVSDLSLIYVHGTAADVLDVVCETELMVASAEAVQINEPEEEQQGGK